MTYVSAHRCWSSPYQNTRTGILKAIESTVDYIEFDTHRTSDGHYILNHDAHIPHQSTDYFISEHSFETLISLFPDIITYDETLSLLKSGNKKAHLDYKFSSENIVDKDDTGHIVDLDSIPEIDLTKRAITVLGAENIVVTTMEPWSVKMVSKWSDVNKVDILVGLSIGSRDYLAPDMSSEEFVSNGFNAIIESNANLAVLNYNTANDGLFDMVTAQGIPTLIWTVDDEEVFSHWFDKGAFLITTNHPEMGIRVRNNRVDS